MGVGPRVIPLVGLVSGGSVLLLRVYVFAQETLYQHWGVARVHVKAGSPVQTLLEELVD